jgi:hypothetical protein
VPSSETVVAEPPVHVSSITVPSVSDGSHFTAAKAALLLVDRSCAAPIEDKKRTADTSVTEDNFDIFVVFVLVFLFLLLRVIYADCVFLQKEEGLATSYPFPEKRKKKEWMVS